MSKEPKFSQAYKNFIVKIVGEAKRLMMLRHYGIDVSFDLEDEGTAAEIRVNVKYYSAHIKCHKNVYDHYKNGDKERVIEMITHEMAHIITEPLYVFAVDAATNTNQKYLETIREQTTENITWLIVREVKKELLSPPKKKKKKK